MSDTVNLRDLDATALLEALPDGAYITDTDRRIIFWNRAAEAITGWRRDDVIGHCCRDNILCHVDKDGHPLCGREHCPLHRAMVTNKQSEVPMLLFAKSKDGRSIPVEVSVSPLHGSGGEVIGGVEVFRDHSPAVEDLNRAQAIQAMALKLDLPRDKRVDVQVRYTPHDRVGGDFYRAEAVDADRYAFLVADVRGHGIASALYAMQLRTLWDDGRALLCEPPQFLGFLNRRVAMLGSGEEGYFATALHLVFNAATGDFTCAAAGHPAPMLLRGRHGADALVVQGPALGLLPDAEYKTAQGRLAPGDTLLLYTDGAFEILNARYQELHEEGLARLAGGCDFSDGAAALESIEESLLRFSNGLCMPDDLTLLSIHRPAMPASRSGVGTRG